MRKIFIHIPKNAGVTIRKIEPIKRSLIKGIPENHISAEYTAAVAATMKKYGEHHGFEHARWRDFRKDLRDNFTAFAVIRNPWSRTVSRYTFNQRQVAKGKAAPSYKLHTFESFLEERHDWGDIPYFWHRAVRNWYPQKDHVTDTEGNLRCDCIRVEHFNEDMVKYFSLKQEPTVKHVSNGRIENNRIVDKKDYREFYNDRTIQIVADWYKDDIDFFGFDFDTTATKNIYYA